MSRNNNIKKFAIYLITSFLVITFICLGFSFFKGDYKTFSVTVGSDSAMGTILNKLLPNNSSNSAESIKETQNTKFTNPNVIERSPEEKDKLLENFNKYSGQEINLSTQSFARYNNKFGEHIYSFYYPSSNNFKIFDGDEHSGSIELITTNLNNNFSTVKLDVFPYEYYEKQSTSVIFNSQDIRDYYNEVFEQHSSYKKLAKEDWSTLNFSNSKVFYFKLEALRNPTYTFVGVVNNKPFSLIYYTENYYGESVVTPEDVLVILQTIEIN